MADLVRRSDVLALAKDVTLKNGAKHRCIDATLVHEIPSAEPEREKGKWINAYTSNVHYMRCSECGAYIEATFFAYDYDCNFCPNCGMPMERI